MKKIKIDMTNYWNILKDKFLKENGIFSIGFADVIGGGISAVFWLYIASIMMPEDYGELHYFLAIAGVAQIFSMIGNSQVLTVYSAKKENIHSTLFLFSLIPSIISFIIIVIIYDRLDAGLLVLGFVIFESINSVVLGQKFYRKYAKMILVQKALTVTLGVSFFYIFGPDGILYALVLTFIPHSIIFMKEFQYSNINFAILKPKKNFIINNYVMTLSGSFTAQIDKLILAPILGFVVLGNYSLLLQIFTFMIIFSSIVFKFLLPQDSSGTKNNNLRRITILVSVGISLLGIIVLPTLIESFFPKFIGAIDAIPIISIAVIPEAIIVLYVSKMLGQEKSKFVLISRLGALAIIVIGFLVVGPILGIIGLAIIFVIAATFQAGFLIITSKLLESGKNVK